LDAQTTRISAALAVAQWTAPPMPASSAAVVNIWERNSPEKQEPAEGRALHPVEPGNFNLWQD
jgi:hypothetical protein